MKSLGIAIVTHNSQQYIGRCLESLRAEGSYPVAIVDSASSDNTVEYSKKLGYPCTALTENRGFGFAANSAASQLNTEYVLFLNPDTIVESGALSRIQDAFVRDTRLAVVGMLLRDEEGHMERDAFGSEPTLGNLAVRHMRRNKRPTGLTSCDWVSGGALAIRRDVFQILGGFDSSFFLYWEDVDLCRRVRQAGYGVAVHGTATVRHSRGGSNIESSKKTEIYDASANRYYQKHYSPLIWNTHRILRSMYRILLPRVH